MPWEECPLYLIKSIVLVPIAKGKWVTNLRPPGSPPERIFVLLLASIMYTQNISLGLPAVQPATTCPPLTGPTGKLVSDDAVPPQESFPTTTSRGTGQKRKGRQSYQPLTTSPASFFVSGYRRIPTPFIKVQFSGCHERQETNSHRVYCVPQENSNNAG